MDAVTLSQARQELVLASLIAYQKPLYQVLSLDDSPAPTPRRSSEGPVQIGQLFRELMEKKP